MNHIIINKRILVIVIALSLSGLTVLAAAEEGLASNIASAQSIPSNQGMASPPPGPFPGQF